MLTKLAANRANMNTAANVACLWLFPRRTRRPALTPGALVQQFRAPGIATQTPCRGISPARPAGPAPVAARALGYSPGTATCHLIAADETWHRYPATRARS